MLHRLRHQLFAVDALIAGYLVFYLLVILISALARETAHVAFTLPFTAGMLVAYLLLQPAWRAWENARTGQRALPTWRIVIAFAAMLSPLAVLPIHFLNLGPIIADSGMVISVRESPDFVATPGYYDPDHAGDAGFKGGEFGFATAWDHRLKAVDTAMFGSYPSLAVREYHAPWLTGLMQLGYLFYYIAPICAVIPLLFQRRWREFRLASAVVAGCLMMTYVGYLLVPATGPRFEGGIEAWLPAESGWFGAEAIYRAIDGAETFRWNAFPSGHVAVSLACVVMALRFNRRIGLALVIPVGFLCAATIYMGYHYVIDVIAGIACTAFSVVAIPRFVRWWERWELPAETQPGEKAL